MRVELRVPRISNLACPTLEVHNIEFIYTFQYRKVYVKSVTGVRDRKYAHVSNSTISRGQLAYYGEREPREPTTEVSSSDTKGGDLQPSRELVYVCQ